jgi:hypothetical protein
LGDHGVLDDLHQQLADDPGMKNILVESTIVRAHPCAADARKKAAVK